jgi:hypothetical protein
VISRSVSRIHADGRNSAFVAVSFTFGLFCRYACTLGIKSLIFPGEVAGGLSVLGTLHRHQNHRRNDTAYT